MGALATGGLGQMGVPQVQFVGSSKEQTCCIPLDINWPERHTERTGSHSDIQNNNPDMLHSAWNS